MAKQTFSLRLPPEIAKQLLALGEIYGTRTAAMCEAIRALAENQINDKTPAA